MKPPVKMKPEREEKDFYDFILWIYILGQCQRDLGEIKKRMATLIDKEDFEEEKPENKELVQLYCDIQHLYYQMDF